MDPLQWMGAVDKNITIIHTSPWVNILWNKSFVLVRNKSIFEFLTSNHRFCLKHEYITHNIAFSSENVSPSESGETFAQINYLLEAKTV